MDSQRSFDAQPMSQSGVTSPTNLSPTANTNPANRDATSTMAGSAAATTTPSSGSGAPGSPALNPRSCVTCRRRKVRCDKHMPCSNCRRAQIACIFPAPGRAPRRPRPKDPNAPPKNSSEREVELMKRLRKLEGIVEELSGQIDVDSTHGGAGSSAAGRHQSSSAESPEAMVMNSFEIPAANLANSVAGGSSDGRDQQSPGNSGQAEPPRRRQSDMTKNFGRLVLTDKGKTRYVSSAFWSKLTDELEHIRAETNMLDDDSDDSADDDTPDTSPGQVEIVDHHAFIFGYRSADVDLRALHPLPSQIPFMWQVYEENVEPLIKVLHVPTTEKLLRDMRKNIDDISPGNEALLFSIYYAAITSLEDDEVQSNLGAEKSKLLAQYRFALEQALSKANFLNTTDIVVLQAFVLFLILARRHDDTRFCWTMTGLAIRIAQGLGVHRDGTNFDLPPFEIEMRRRLWWAICTLDLRSAEELGTDLTIIDRSFDTQLPSNINDSDIDPDTKVLPPSRIGPTDCAVALVRCEICALARRLHTVSSAMASICPRDAAKTFAERERMLVEVYESVEQRFTRHFVNHDNPIFWMAAMISRIIIAKMGLVIYLPLLVSEEGTEELSRITRDRLFISAIEIVEYNHMLNTDDRCRQWRWLFQTYTQWHAIAYLLMESARRPWSATVERAWVALNGTLTTRHQMDLAKMANHTAVWMPLRKLFLKARRHREAEITRLRADPEAARKLDFEDRLNPSSARFGPVPGTEQELAEMREQWRAMMRPGAVSPAPTPQPEVQSPPAMGSESARMLSGAQSGALGGTPDSANNNPTLGPVVPDLSDAFSEVHPFNPVELLSFVYDGDVSQFLSNGGNATASSSTSTPPNPGLAKNLVSANGTNNDALNLLRQEALFYRAQPGAPGPNPITTAKPTKDNPPPWLWSDPFTAMNTKFDDAPGGGLGADGSGDSDFNMDMDDDFNWQSWQENIRGFGESGSGAPANSAW